MVLFFTAPSREVQPPCSLPEGCELIEGVPEERGLPLGLCQGKDLLLGHAGGHGDVALVHGVQVLVRRGHGASAVAFGLSMSRLLGIQHGKLLLIF